RPELDGRAALTITPESLRMVRGTHPTTMKLSNYSLNYSRAIAAGGLTIEDFLGICRALGLEGASLHGRDLPDLRPATLARVRRALLDQGLSLAMFTVSTNFGVTAERQAAET